MILSKLTSNILNSIQKVIRKKKSTDLVQLHEPFFEDTNCLEYIKDCIESGWVSSAGEWVNKFEKKYVCLQVQIML